MVVDDRSTSSFYVSLINFQFQRFVEGDRTVFYMPHMQQISLRSVHFSSSLASLYLRTLLSQALSIAVCPSEAYRGQREAGRSRDGHQSTPATHRHASKVFQEQRIITKDAGLHITLCTCEQNARAKRELVTSESFWTYKLQCGLLQPTISEDR